MEIQLQNGLLASVVINEAGQLKQVAANLKPLNHQGFVVVSFYNNGCAQETCVSTSDGFMSVRYYENGHLAKEVFRDVLHHKTFSYTYDNKGQVVETQMDSKQQSEFSLQNRPVLTRSPIGLYDSLYLNPQLLRRASIAFPAKEARVR